MWSCPFVCMKLFVFSPGYFMDLGRHVFPTTKYQLVRDALIRESIAFKDEFVEPRLIDDKELEIVHIPFHIERLRRLSTSPDGMSNGENPINESVFRAAKLHCDGTYQACLLAFAHGVAMNIGGGFHHAFSGLEEGFCYFNDMAYALTKLVKEKKANKAMVVDCDVHQGNGTASILRDSNHYFTFSIHQQDTYPDKEQSSYDIGLFSYHNIDDNKYLQELSVLEKLVSQFKPEIILYQAGADPYQEDKLGRFKLSMDGLMMRDSYVLGLAKKNKIPVAVCLGGGYAQKTEDVVRIHCTTARVMKMFV